MLRLRLKGSLRTVKYNLHQLQGFYWLCNILTIPFFSQSAPIFVKSITIPYHWEHLLKYLLKWPIAIDRLTESYISLLSIINHLFIKSLKYTHYQGPFI